MRTFLTVCSTLACAGGAFVAYEHPEWIRQSAQQWEAWRKSAATAPPAMPVARAIDDVAGQVTEAAAELRERVAVAERHPMAGKPLDQWFNELSGLSSSTTAGEQQFGEARNELVEAAQTLAGRTPETPAEKASTSADKPVVERDASRFRTSQQVAADEPLVAKAVSTSRSPQAATLASRTLGQGSVRTLVVAGLNGEDRAAVRAVEELASQLAGQAAVLQEQTLLVVPSANPGGIQAGRRFNARNVDLNRNFPGRRYRPQAEFSGTFPASEAETQQLLRLMFEFQPERVIHVIDDPLATHVLFNRAATELAGQMQRQQQVAIERLDLDRLPGSLEEFADGVFHVPVLVVCLKPDESAGVLTALVSTVEQNPGALQEPVREVRPLDSEPAPAGPVAGPRSSTPTVPTSGRGYEELPPPPQQQ